MMTEVRAKRIVRWAVAGPLVVYFAYQIMRDPEAVKMVGLFLGLVISGTLGILAMGWAFTNTKEKKHE